MERVKPKFIRRNWRLKVRLSQKKKRKWVSARGRDNKTRLGFKGYPRKVKIGWGSSSAEKGLVKGLVPHRVENLKEISALKKGNGVIIGKVGRKNREALTAKAKEMGLIILNKYKTQYVKK